MGAIFAILTRDAGLPARERLDAGLAALAPWGSGRAELWADGGVALGCAARGEAPEGVRDPLPVSLPQAQEVTGVVDAALTDRVALCRALEAPSATTDAELVVRAYLRWGERAPERLTGPFAFAIWDGRHGLLTCARDHVGVRPLYVAETGGQLTVATDLEAVLALSGLPRRADEEAEMARQARHNGILLRRSFVAGVEKVAPGEALVARAPGRLRRLTYWAPGPRPPLRLPSTRDYSEALRETVASATADAVRTRARVGAHVSGGLDSSLVAVLGHRALQREGRGLERAFSWSPPRDSDTVPGDERDRAQAVASELGVPVTFTWATDEHRQRVIALQELLLPTAALTAESVVVDHAAAEGIGVLLTGWGGDEAASFNGRGQLAHLARTGHWRRLMRNTVLPLRRNGAHGARCVKATAMTLWERVALPFLPDQAYVRLFRKELAWTRNLPGPARGKIAPAAERLRRDAQAQRRIRRSPQAMQVAILSSGYVTARLEAWAQYAGPRGVDHRFPLLDRRVLDLALAFPSHLWLADGYNRWIMRLAADPLLPASICWGMPKEEPAATAWAAAGR
jgi:asparagine synthase (glutamine-hydrolysing)